jgi:hypothetical protein
MTGFDWLMIASVFAVAALFGALAYYLFTLIDVLGRVGGSPTSFLAKIRMGVRAIEVETGHLPPEVTQLNAGLTAVRDGLVQIDGNLDALIASVSAQEAP